MTKIFNTYKINNHDILKEKKLDAFNNIKDYLQGIDKEKEVKLEILEKHLWEIIRQYKLSFQAQDESLRYLSAKYPRFEEDWYEKIAKATDGSEINSIQAVVIRALVKHSGLLTQELKKMRNETAEVWLRTDFENGRKRGGFVEFSNPESVQILRGKLGKFRAKFPFSVNNGDWGKEWARKVLDDTLQAEIKEAEVWEKKAEAGKKEAEAGLRSIHDGRLNKIKHILKNAEFSQYKKKNGTWEWKVIVNEEEMKIESFRNYVKIFIESDSLKEEWLPTGEKKADLLNRLEALIREKTAKDTNENTNSNSDDNSAPKPEKNELEKWAEEIKSKAVKKITKALQEAKLSQSNLEAENQNWQEQIDLAAEEGSIIKIEDIESKLLVDISNKKEAKENGAELDNLLQKFSGQDQPANGNEFMKALKEINKNLGERENETRSQAVKSAMLEKDPELYFETFMKWVKEEMEVCGMKDDELEDQERKLINGEIDDRNESKKIEKKLAEKVVAKKQSWSFAQKLSKWQNWLKTKAASLAVNYLEEETKKIKQQIYSLKFSANPFKKQAYQSNEEKVKNLLAELNNVSQKNQTVAPTEKGFFQPKYIIPATLLIVGLVITAIVVVRNRKRRLGKVKK